MIQSMLEYPENAQGSVGSKLTRASSGEKRPLTDNLGLVGRAAQQKYASDADSLVANDDAIPAASETRDTSVRGLLSKAITILSSIETTVKSQLAHAKRAAIRDVRTQEERDLEQQDAIRIDESKDKSSEGGSSLAKLALAVTTAVEALPVVLTAALSALPELIAAAVAAAIAKILWDNPDRVKRVITHAEGTAKDVAHDIAHSFMPQTESTGKGYQKATAIPRAVIHDKQFQQRVTKSAHYFNMSEDDLYRIMGVESAGSYSPSKRNPKSGATGLIQFMPKFAPKDTGRTVEELAKMSRTEQMDFVDRYLKQHGLDKIKNPTLDDAYMTVFYPKAVGKASTFPIARKGSKVYEQNKLYDLNHDGIITKAEVGQAIRKIKIPATKVTEDQKAPIKPHKPKSKKGEHLTSIDEHGNNWNSDNGGDWKLVKASYSKADALNKANNDSTTVIDNRTTVIAPQHSSAAAQPAVMPSRPPNPNAAWGKDYQTYFTGTGSIA